MKIVSAGPAFYDSADSLNNEFKDDYSNSIIILGAIYFSALFSAMKKNKLPSLHDKYDKVIVFNQEQLHSTQRNFLTPEYIEWIKQADEVWDYDETNFDLLYKFNKNIKLHLLKPYKNWSTYPIYKKDIDILFYGLMNEHRKKLLDHLGKKYKVVICNGVYRNDLDNYILRSKILLNIHYYYECSLQEQARMIRWIGSPCRIISEKSVKNYLGVKELTYEELYNL